MVQQLRDIVGDDDPDPAWPDAQIAWISAEPTSTPTVGPFKIRMRGAVASHLARRPVAGSRREACTGAPAKGGTLRLVSQRLTTRTFRANQAKAIQHLSVRTATMLRNDRPERAPVAIFRT